MLASNFLQLQLPPTPVTPAQNALKAVLITTLFFATFIACTLAFVLKRFALSRSEPGLPPTHNVRDNDSTGHQRHHSRFAKVFSLVSCFGGGVFLATCLLDLLPDSIDSVEKAEKAIGKSFTFPVAELGLAAGFLFILLLEQSVIYANEKEWLAGSDRQHLLGHQHQHGATDGGHSHFDSRREGGAGDTNGEAEDIHFDPEAHSTIRAVLLVFALSLHAIFEGLSVGLLADVSALLQISAALLIHKLVVGFSLGVRLVQSKLKTTAIIICCAIFSGQVLVGGLIGIALMDLLNSSSQSAQYLITGILQAFACGTFLYITCFEILPHELNQSANRPVKMLFLIAGFALIALFMSLFPDLG